MALAHRREGLGLLDGPDVVADPAEAGPHSARGDQQDLLAPREEVLDVVDQLVELGVVEIGVLVSQGVRPGLDDDSLGVGRQLAGSRERRL